MNDVVRRLQQLTQPTMDAFVQVLDIVLVGLLLFMLLRLVRSTRAWRILVGIVIFVVVLTLSDYLGFRTLHYLLEKATLLGPVALVILFLPELRQTLESFAKFGMITDANLSKSSIAARTIEEIVAAVNEMASLRIGALIVVERGNRLNDICSNGVKLEAEVSSAILNSVFYGANPLHDGAAIIRGDKIMAAACRLPLSDSTRIDPNVHMRHRAGLGISEQSDCLAIVVSEERGQISVAIDGQLFRMADHVALRDRLNLELRVLAEPRRFGRKAIRSSGPETTPEQESAPAEVGP